MGKRRKQDNSQNVMKGNNYQYSLVADWITQSHFPCYSQIKLNALEIIQQSQKDSESGKKKTH